MMRPRSKKAPKRPAMRAMLANVASQKTQRSRPRLLSKPTAALKTVSVKGYAMRDPISHPLFGEGVIAAIDGEKLTIEFADGRVKQILDSYVKRPRR
jgi:hypothetical protein